MDSEDWGDVETLLDDASAPAAELDGDAETLLDDAGAPADEMGGEGRAEMERAPTGACAQCQQRLRWSRDGSGIVCRNCGAFTVQSRVQITYEDIVRTRSQISQVPHLQTVPFDIGGAIEYMLSEPVRAVLRDKIAANVAREMGGKVAQRNLNVAGLRYMRRRMPATPAQVDYLTGCVREYTYGTSDKEAIAILQRFLVDGASRAWYNCPRYPWMCALLYPDEGSALIVKLLQQYVDRRSHRAMKPLSESEERMERLRKRAEPPMDPLKIDPADADAPVYPAPKRAAALSGVYLRIARWAVGARKTAGGDDESAE